MRVIKIGAIWCGGCLIMNKVWNKLIKNYSFDYTELDLDMDEDEVKNYNPGDKLPIFIVFDGNKEVERFIGEFSYDDLEKKLKDVGVLNEENN
jgi:thiol-disulfide isomerase/thioredoxin